MGWGRSDKMRSHQEGSVSVGTGGRGTEFDFRGNGHTVLAVPRRQWKGMSDLAEAEG